MQELFERRGSTRYCVNQLIKVSAMQEEYLWASAKDISIDGFSALSASPLETLTPIFAMLELKGLAGTDESISIQIEAFVAWSTMEGDECEFGATFTKIKKKDRALLETWLANQGEASGKDGCDAG